MARRPRSCPPGTFQHVISEFVDREYWLADSRDREAYLDFVGRARGGYDGDFLAYALMSSHLHSFLHSGLQPISALYHPLHIRYAAYWHDRYSGRGPVFASRPKNHEVDPERVAEAIAYIHMNPVRAGVCERPADTSWTSHRAFLRLEAAPTWLRVEQALGLCGFDDTESGRSAFDEFVRACATRHWEREDSSQRPNGKAFFSFDVVKAHPSIGEVWPRVIREVAVRCGIGTDFCVETAMRPEDVRARLLTAQLATGCCYTSNSEVARRLSVTEGAVRKMLVRPVASDDVAWLEEVREDVLRLGSGGVVAARVGGE